MELTRPPGYQGYSFPFIVEKPWGREEWLDLIQLEDGRGYCYKRLHINQGTKTSFQYHEKKLETNYIVSGEAEVWLENELGVVEKKVMGPGSPFTVIPLRKHRIIALTDIVLLEVSTPEVDDVIRLQDDSGRRSGKIESEHLKK